ncbi:hypothetical protein SCUCBS95973_001105 [Sporothrix curviconia]|uniref:Cytochrome P450 monooxygenase n=1 Tax=Sporothrix curviconia TaxID=1260050 RepID=A0ABP0AVU6_9PEZI
MPFLILPMHDKYGPVVRIAPDQLSFLDTAAWRDIYGRRSDLATTSDPNDEDADDELTKDPRFYHIEGVETILSESRANHAILRRQLLPGFSDRAMREQAPMIERYVTLLVKRLREVASSKCVLKSVDMFCWYSMTTFDIIGDLAFGEPFGYLAAADIEGKEPWIDALAAVYTGLVVVFCKLTGITGWVFPVLARLFPTMADHNQGGIDKIKRRMALPERRPDLIQGLVDKNAHDWGHGLTIQQISGTAGIIVLAGAETTTKLMTATTYFLAKHPEALARATAEVRGAFASAEDITLLTATATTIPYVLACLNESLRRYPPAGVGLPRLTPKGGAMIAGVFVPGNTAVACWQLAMNHNAAYWDDPFKFEPERFLDGAKYGKDRMEAMQPFSVGPRNCIGRNLAFAEARLILAQVLFNFDLALAEPANKDWLDQKAYVIWDTPAMRVFLKEAAHGTEK